MQPVKIVITQSMIDEGWNNVTDNPIHNAIKDQTDLKVHWVSKNNVNIDGGLFSIDPKLREYSLKPCIAQVRFTAWPARNRTTGNQPLPQCGHLDILFRSNK